jgi:hypothetical protein
MGMRHPRRADGLDCPNSRDHRPAVSPGGSLRRLPSAVSPVASKPGTGTTSTASTTSTSSGSIASPHPGQSVRGLSLIPVPSPRGGVPTRPAGGPRPRRRRGVPPRSRVLLLRGRIVEEEHGDRGRRESPDDRAPGQADATCRRASGLRRCIDANRPARRVYEWLCGPMRKGPPMGRTGLEPVTSGLSSRRSPS